MQPPTTDWRLWLVAITAVGGLALSLYNAWVASKDRAETKKNREEIQRVERDNKARAIRLEEFRAAVRDPVRLALGPILDLSRRVEAASKTTLAIDALADDLHELNQETVQALGRLLDALTRANDSKFANGTDWAAEIPDAEDSIGSAFNDAQSNEKPIVDRLTALATASSALKKLNSDVERRIESAVERYAQGNEEPK